MARKCTKRMIASLMREIGWRNVYHTNDYETFERLWMARNVYYTSDFEAHENLSHKQSVLFHGTTELCQWLFQVYFWECDMWEFSF